MVQDRPRFSRRKVLQTTAVGAAGLVGVSGAVGASSTSSDYREATRLREEHNDNDVFVQYLRDRGYSVTTQNEEFSVPTESSDEDGIEPANHNTKADLNLNLNLIKKNKNFIDGHFNWSVGNAQSGGTRGAAEDVITVDWPKGKFTINNTNHFEEPYGNPKNRITLYEYQGRKYATWEFDDSGIGSGAIYDASVRCDVHPEGGNSGDRIYLKYYHNWANMQISGISTGSPIAVNFSKNSNQWVSDPVSASW